MPVQNHAQRFAGNIFHDHPVIALHVRAEIDQRHEVRVLEVQALGHAAHLDLEVMAPNQLERDFLAAVADGVIHLAEAAPADATLERVTVQNSLC